MSRSTGRGTSTVERQSCSTVSPRHFLKEQPMKYVASVVSIAVLLLVAVVSAQPPAGGGQMQGQKIGIATSLQRGYATFKTNYTAAAQKMPDADYNFKPGS